MEIIGFKVDSVYVQNWMTKHKNPIPQIDLDGLGFMHTSVGFMKDKTVSQFKESRNPIEKLEYKLNSIIVPK